MDSREIYNHLKPLIDIMTYSDQERHIKFLNLIFSARISDPITLLKDLAAEETDDKILSRIVLSLGNFSDPRLIECLSGFLTHKDDRIRANAVEALGKIKDPSVVDLLTPMLEDKNNRVVANAAMSLWKFGGLRMLNVLVNLLENGKDDYIKASAAFALGEIGGLQVVNPLMRCISTDNEMLKSNILKALGKSGDSNSAPVISQYLKSGSFKIRQAAVTGLGSLSDHDFSKAIIELLNEDENEDMAQDIVAALVNSCKIEDVSSVAELIILLNDPRKWVKKAVLNVIETFEEKCINHFIEPLISDADTEIKELASSIIRKNVTA
jgi:HEAT repeat protein